MSAGPLFTEVYDTDLHARLRNPDASYLLACWELARTGEALPREADFRRRVPPSVMPSLMILRPEPDGDFTYVHYGELIARNAGFDMTGRRVSSFQGATRSFYGELYARATSERRPLASVHRLGDFKERPMWERVILPVATGDAPSAIYVVNRVRELDNDVTMLTPRTPGSGLVALQFARGPDNAITAAMIVGANRQAQAMTGRRLDELLDRPVADCFAGLMREGVWERCLEVSRARSGQGLVIADGGDGLRGPFELWITPFHDGVTIEFRPAVAGAAAA